jgi:hypothetical protein
LKADFQIDGTNLCCNNHYGNRLVIPLGNEAVRHPITERLVAKLNMPIALIPSANKAEQALAIIVIDSLVSGLLWVLYYQTKAFKKPFLEDLGLKDDEFLGQIYNSELNLCFACLNFWNSNNLSENSKDFNVLDMWERLIAAHVCDALNSRSLRGNKEDDEKQIQYLIDSLNKWDNSYSSEKPFHHFNLIDSAIAIGQPQRTDNVPMRKARKQFRDGALEEYKEAWFAYKRAIHTGKFKKLHIDGEDLYVQMTRRTRTRIA